MNIYHKIGSDENKLNGIILSDILIYKNVIYLKRLSSTEFSLQIIVLKRKNKFISRHTYHNIFIDKEKALDFYKENIQERIASIQKKHLILRIIQR